MVILPRKIPASASWSELDFARHTGNVVSGNHRTQNSGDVQNLHLGLRQLLIGHGAVAGAEVDGVGENLTDATAAANRLIIESEYRNAACGTR